MDKKTKTLILRFSSMGDIILSLPVVHHYIKENPNYLVDFATKDRFTDILNLVPGVNQVYPLKTSRLSELFKLGMLLRKEKYNRVIDLHLTTRTRFLCLLLWRPTLKFSKIKKPYLTRFILVKFKINLFKKAHNVQMAYWKACGFPRGPQMSGTIKIQPTELPKSIDSEQFQKQEDIFSKPIVFMTGTAWKSKTWPLQNYLQLAIHCKRRFPRADIFLLGGKQEFAQNEELIEQFSHQLPLLTPPVNLAVKLNISQTAWLFKNCGALVCGDTGLFHLAQLMFLPTMLILGSTVREFGFIPPIVWGKILHQNVACRPCSSKGKNDCQVKDFRCLTLTTPATVFAELQEIFEIHSQSDEMEPAN